MNSGHERVKTDEWLSFTIAMDHLHIMVVWSVHAYSRWFTYLLNYHSRDTGGDNYKMLIIHFYAC